VLLPGAGGEAWYWHLVADRLRARGHEVIAPDLPAAADDAGLEAYADTIVDAAGDRSGTTMVAQSMAAFSGTMACERLDVARLILVAPMIPVPGETPGEWWENSGQAVARRENDIEHGRDPDAPFDVMTTFFHDLPQDVVAAAFERGEPRQSDRPFGDPWPLEAWPAIPTRVIAGRHDRLFPLEFMRRLSSQRLGIEPEVVDSGHLPALSRPAELTERLVR
jgi:pimeloyl-ACP methyl ester carboxylesterase